MKKIILGAFVCVVLSGCVTTSPRQDWIENGKRVGTITKHKAAGGSFWQYRDTGGVLCRTEKHDQNGALSGGASVAVFSHDSSGRLATCQYFDANNQPACHPDGYYSVRHHYSLDSDHNSVDTLVFLDATEHAVNTRQGYAYRSLVFEGTSRMITEIYWEDARRKPAACVWDGESGVARVKYTVLEGIGDIRCGVYYNAEGEIIQRKQVSGACSCLNVSTTTTTCGPGRTTTTTTTTRQY